MRDSSSEPNESGRGIPELRNAGPGSTTSLRRTIGPSSPQHLFGEEHSTEHRKQSLLEPMTEPNTEGRAQTGEQGSGCILRLCRVVQRWAVWIKTNERPSETSSCACTWPNELQQRRKQTIVCVKEQRTTKMKFAVVTTCVVAILLQVFVVVVVADDPASSWLAYAIAKVSVWLLLCLLMWCGVVCSAFSLTTKQGDGNKVLSVYANTIVPEKPHVDFGCALTHTNTHTHTHTQTHTHTHTHTSRQPAFWFGIEPVPANNLLQPIVPKWLGYGIVFWQGRSDSEGVLCTARNTATHDTYPSSRSHPEQKPLRYLERAVRLERNERLPEPTPCCQPWRPYLGK